MATKEELLQGCKRLGIEISRLKRELASLGVRKRELYARRDEVRKGFRESIEKVKQLRARRDGHTASVKELKAERNAASETVKKLSTEISSLRQEKESAFKKLGVRRPPEALAGEITRLEFKLETSAIPFEQEKRLTKIIKEKKGELKKAQQVSTVVEKLRESAHQLSPAKATSEHAHQELQLHAAVSQKLHEEMVQEAKKADSIKKVMQPIDEELRSIIQKSGELQLQLQQKLSQLSAAEAELAKLRAEEEARKKEERQKQIEAKEQELTAKMKSGKKLTNRDLMMLRDE